MTATTQVSVQSAEEVSRAINEISKGAINQSEGTEKGAKSVNAMGNLVNQDKTHRLDLNALTESIDTLKELVKKIEVTKDAIVEIMDVIKKTSGIAKEIKTTIEVLASLNASVRNKPGQ